MEQFASGIRDVGRGLGALNAHPTLWKWVIAPAVVTIGLIVALGLGVARLVAPVSAWAAEHLPSWIASVAGSVLTTLIVVVLVAGAVMVFVPVAGIIAGPFNERLSEQLEEKLTGRTSPPFSFGRFLHDLWLGVAHGIRRLLVTLVGIAAVLVVGWIPGIGQIAAMVVAAWLTANSAAYDSYDAVLARRSLAYRDKLAYLARHRGRTLGLGAGVAGLLLVPVVNLVALGLGAAGATVAALALETAAHPQPGHAMRR